MAEQEAPAAHHSLLSAPGLCWAPPKTMPEKLMNLFDALQQPLSPRGVRAAGSCSKGTKTQLQAPAANCRAWGWGQLPDRPCPRVLKS